MCYRIYRIVFSDIVKFLMIKENHKMLSLKKLLCVFTAFFALISLSACTLPTKIIGDFPDPEDTVTAFFDSVCAGDFEKSDTYLEGVSLVVKNQPQDIFSQKLFDYLLKSYQYQLIGNVNKKQFEADCQISFRYLDFNLLTDDMKSASTKLGKRYIAESKEGYVTADENGISLTDSGAQKIAAEVLDSLMVEPEKYYSTQIFDVSLKYNSYQWLVYISDGLFEAISGKYETAE